MPDGALLIVLLPLTHHREGTAVPFDHPIQRPLPLDAEPGLHPDGSQQDTFLGLDHLDFDVGSQVIARRDRLGERKRQAVPHLNYLFAHAATPARPARNWLGHRSRPGRAATSPSTGASPRTS